MDNEMNKNNEQNTELAEQESRDQVTYQAPVDIMESSDGYVVVADMPGLDPTAITIRLDQEMLVIEGESTIDGLDPIRFRRMFRVVRGLDPEDVSADYKQGILTVTLPKPASHKPRQITVTAG